MSDESQPTEGLDARISLEPSEIKRQFAANFVTLRDKVGRFHVNDDETEMLESIVSAYVKNLNIDPNDLQIATRVAQQIHQELTTIGFTIIPIGFCIGMPAPPHLPPLDPGNDFGDLGR